MGFWGLGLCVGCFMWVGCSCQDFGEVALADAFVEGSDTVSSNEPSACGSAFPVRNFHLRRCALFEYAIEGCGRDGAVCG